MYGLVTDSIRLAYIDEINQMETDIYYTNISYVYIDKEPDEVKLHIPISMRNSRHCAPNAIPICLQYKIQQGIDEIADLSERCDIDCILDGRILCPQIMRKTQISQFQINATFCIQCGNYLKGANRSFRFPTRKVAKSAQCICTDNKYYTEYICDIFKLLYYAKSNITLDNTQGDIKGTMMGLRRNVQMYNIWCLNTNISNTECPYVISFPNLSILCYSESDSDSNIESDFESDFECDSNASTISMFGIGDSNITKLSYISSDDD